VRRSESKKYSHLLASLTCVVFLSFPLTARAQAALTHEPYGVQVRSGADVLRLIVCGPDVIHIVATPPGGKVPVAQSPWIVAPCGSSDFSLKQDEHEVVIETVHLAAHISLANGRIVVEDRNGRALLQEFKQNPRHYERRGGDNTYSVTDNFRPAEDEAINGLGQHQNGIFNNRGSEVLLAQKNTDIAIPFFLSTAGYGVLWNSASPSTFDNRFPTELTLKADSATAIDYYFFYGPEADQIIHHYRDLTGHVPMYPRWAYGLFQSKDRYKSQGELLGIAAKYREQHIPLDTIVQDYVWWTKQGASDFNKSYPDPAGMVDQLHRLHVHAMISVWPNFEEGAEIVAQMRQKNMLVPGLNLYDPTNPAARDLYWDMLPSTLLKKGFDAFWLDASEPEDDDGNSDRVLHDRRLIAGDGDQFSNAYPFFHSESIYQHWRKTLPSKRVFVLTRSAFLGQQRNAAASWSGDVESNFWSLSRQIPSGLNFMLSGAPYWTTDIGGYGYPIAKDTRDASYQEVFTRWFEYGTFCPLFRIHGRRANHENEIWSYGPVAPILIQYDKLRYRLLPYIYSEAWQVTANDGTMMRPLVMDWRTDTTVWKIGDEFMFGPAILVNPVSEAGTTERSVYLPQAATWYDFWTGDGLAGGQRIHATAPLDRIPLFVRGGAILPLGPEIEYANEKAADPIELRVYRGADAAFDLYEDEGDNYNYENGSHAIIPIRWNEASRTLTIGARSGQFSGMLQHRTFRVVLVGKGHGTGEEPTESVDRVVEYDGQAVTAKESTEAESFEKRPQLMTARRGFVSCGEFVDTEFSRLP
jgi:alpha-D-xyloside xylohydrolase